MRFPPGCFLPNGRVAPNAIRLPNQSGLRSKYSDPPDALAPRCCAGENLQHFGVIAISVGALRTPLKVLAAKPTNGYLSASTASRGAEPDRNYTIAVTHDPIMGCFAHAEMRDLRVRPSDVLVEVQNLCPLEVSRLQIAISRQARIVFKPGGQNRER